MLNIKGTFHLEHTVCWTSDQSNQLRGELPLPRDHVKGREGCREQAVSPLCSGTEEELTTGNSHDKDCEAQLQPPQVPAQKDPATFFIVLHPTRAPLLLPFRHSSFLRAMCADCPDGGATGII